MNVKLVSVTATCFGDSGPKTAEELMVYTARVSSPQNQANLDTGAKLLRYCIKNKHWSVFAQADMTVEIETSRAISAQILRHKSFDFQEFSQRYAQAFGFEIYEARRQDSKNRQNSIDDLPEHDKEWFEWAQETLHKYAGALYNDAISRGIAKECARFLLPMGVSTRIYMKGSVRSWLTYFKVRLDKSTQLEHREIAEATYRIFKEQFPICAQAFEEIEYGSAD